MNEQLRHPHIARRPRPGTTQAADGLARRKWTAAEVQTMLEAGLVHEDDRFELIGGELVAMAAKGNRHERLKIALNGFWGRRLPPEITLAPESPLRLGPHDEPEPDLYLYPSAINPEDVRGDTVLLVVEAADSSLGYDLGLKSRLYASFGVREYWVIDANTMVTTIHREPAPASASYSAVREFAAEALLTPELAPSLAIRLADLGLG